MKQLALYSTSHCHLCETAKALLAKHYPALMLNMIDIADDEILLAQYGARIPVLQRLDNGAELAWPFDEEKLNNFLSV